MTAESAIASQGQRFIYLDRRVCAVTPDKVDIHPARSIVVLPLAALLLGLATFPIIYLWGDSLPLEARLLLTLFALFIVPVSGLGLVYSIAGANIVVDRKKQSAVLQQGYLGMGVGTQELIPFWKIDFIAVREVTPHDERGHQKDFAQYEVFIRKLSGREISVGTVTVPRAAAAEGLERAREVAALIAGLSDSSVQTQLSGPQPAGSR